MKKVVDYINRINVNDIIFILFEILEICAHLRITNWPIWFPDHFIAGMNLSYIAVVMLSVWYERERIDEWDWLSNEKIIYVFVLVLLAIIFWKTDNPLLLTAGMMVVSWVFVDSKERFKIKAFIHLVLMNATLLGGMMRILPYYETKNKYSVTDALVAGYTSHWAFLAAITVVVVSIYLSRSFKREILEKNIWNYCVAILLSVLLRKPIKIIVAPIKYVGGYHRCLGIMFLFFFMAAIYTFFAYNNREKKGNERKVMQLFKQAIPVILIVATCFGAYKLSINNYQKMLDYQAKVNGLKKIDELDEYMDIIDNRFSTEEYDVFLAVSDSLGERINVNIMKKLKNMGIKTNLLGKGWNAYIAVLEGGQTIYEQYENETNKSLTYKTKLKDTTLKIQSMPYYSGNTAHIYLDGMDYAVGKRGINIVIYDNKYKKVIDSVAFDTILSSWRYTPARRLGL